MLFFQLNKICSKNFRRQFVSMLMVQSVASDNLCQSLLHILSPHQLGGKCIDIGDNICFWAIICVTSIGINSRQRQYVQGRQYMSPKGITNDFLYKIEKMHQCYLARENTSHIIFFQSKVAVFALKNVIVYLDRFVVVVP